MGFKRSWVQIPPARYLKPHADLMFYVYVLRSRKTGRRYIGSCEDVEDRLRHHNLGHSKATRHGVPWFLVRSENFSTRTEAASKERYYKTGRGRDELDRLDG
jgi:putative endonuclease